MPFTPIQKVVRPARRAERCRILFATTVSGSHFSAGAGFGLMGYATATRVSEMAERRCFRAEMLLRRRVRQAAQPDP